MKFKTDAGVLGRHQERAKTRNVDFEDATYTVQDEVTKIIHYTGTYEDCKTFIGNQPDWEKYGIVSPVSGRFVSFVLSRYT